MFRFLPKISKQYISIDSDTLWLDMSEEFARGRDAVVEAKEAFLDNADASVSNGRLSPADSCATAGKRFPEGGSTTNASMTLAMRRANPSDRIFRFDVYQIFKILTKTA